MRATTWTATVLLCVTCLTLSASPGRAESTRLLWQYPGVENVVSTAWIEDLDGDGVADILFESYDAGAPQTDHLFAISGASEGTGTVIWSARPLGGPSNSGGYGEYCLSVSPDLSGDGTSEVLYGAAWGNRSAFSLDGMTGSTIWSFDTYEDSPPSPPAEGWVYAVYTLGSDLTGDAFPEVLFCAGSENHCVYCADGVTGEILWHYRGQDAFGYVQSIADVDGDGIRDVVACQIDNYPKVYVFSGAGGGGGAADLIWNQSGFGSPWACCELALPDPFTATIVVGCWDNTIYGYDAATGNLRWSGNVGAYVMRVVVINDVDEDGIDDIGVASWGNAGRVHSGANGEPIWVTPVGNDCWTCDPVDDINGDGFDELAVGSFNGRVYLMSGLDGAILWNYYVGDKIFTIRGVPDLTGNGIADVVAGTQRLNNSGGICYAFEGNDDITVSVDAGLVGVPGRLRVGPNPSRGETYWSFSLQRPAGRLALELFDPSGRLVRVLARGGGRLGTNKLAWDGRDRDGRPMPAGIYLGRLIDGERLLGTGRAVLLP